MIFYYFITIKSGKSAEGEGAAKKKRHSPNPDNIKFNKDGLLLEVSNLAPNSEVMLHLLYIT